MQRNSIPIRLECGAAAVWSDGIEFNVAEQMVLDRFGTRLILILQNSCCVRHPVHLVGTFDQGSNNSQDQVRSGLFALRGVLHALRHKAKVNFGLWKPSNHEQVNQRSSFLTWGSIFATVPTHGSPVCNFVPLLCSVDPS